MPSHSLFHNKIYKTAALCVSNWPVLFVLVSLMFILCVLVSDFDYMPDMNDFEYGWYLDEHVLNGPCISQCILFYDVCWLFDTNGYDGSGSCVQFILVKAFSGNRYIYIIYSNLIFDFAFFNPVWNGFHYRWTLLWWQPSCHENLNLTAKS